MNADRWVNAGLVALLIAVGALAWRLSLGDGKSVDVSALAELPLSVRGWHGQDVPMTSGVEEMLAADFNVQRVYQHAIGGAVWLYIGYYGTERGGRPEHTPWTCYPSNGWEIVRHTVLDARDGGPRANELVVAYEGELRLVHFWYQSQRQTGMLGGLEQATDRIVGRVMDGRADGSLVRISTRFDGPSGEAGARARLRSFARSMLPVLEAHWPQELASPAT